VELWDEITNLSSRTLHTLDRNNRFDVVDVTVSGVIVKPHSTKKDRLVTKKEIEGAFRELAALGQITRAQIEANHSPRNPVYVAALLAELPGVHHTIKPIVLRYSKEYCLL
jgi:hypothetical protein